MFFPNTASPLLKQDVEVSSKGELVVIRIGNAELLVHYEHGLCLSEWVREEARLIKRLAGQGNTLRSLAVPDEDDNDALPYQGGVAIHVKPKQQTWQRSDVCGEGKLICIKVGNQTMKMHFENALKLAQWIRVRAKEARNRAGDTRHWSEISETNK